jgi:succinoglycan biosynthesis transport protein ExoP
LSIVQFLRILWARKWLVVATTVSCICGAFVVTKIATPRWEAHSRVMLDLMKPDPVTGEVLNGPGARTYAATQIELIRDYAVAGRVVEELGWLSDPSMIASYQHRRKSDSRDFRRWAAQTIIDNTKATLVDSSNILEISFNSTSAAGAKQVADALRQAYIDQSQSFRRDDANRNVQWYQDQADKLRVELDAAEVAKGAFERQNGVVMQDDKTDLESARLRSLSSAGPAPIFAPMQMPSTGPSQLAQADAEIAEASKNLGPNHPELQAMKAKRAALAASLAKEESSRSLASGAASAEVGAQRRAIQAQKSLVISQRDKVGRLMQLQTEVDLKLDQYNKTQSRAAEARQSAAVASGLVPLGTATTPNAPSFPNKPLIMGGAMMLGLAVGLLAALLAEFFARRVRGVEDMQSALDAPLLAVIAAPPHTMTWFRPRRPAPAVVSGTTAPA